MATLKLFKPVRSTYCVDKDGMVLSATRKGQWQDYPGVSPEVKQFLRATRQDGTLLQPIGELSGGEAVRSDDLLASLESLLRECAQRFGNASVSKLSEKTAAEMCRKCGDALRKVEEANDQAQISSEAR